MQLPPYLLSADSQGHLKVTGSICEPKTNTFSPLKGLLSLLIQMTAFTSSCWKMVFQTGRITRQNKYVFTPCPINFYFVSKASHSGFVCFKIRKANTHTFPFMASETGFMSGFWILSLSHRHDLPSCHPIEGTISGLAEYPACWALLSVQKDGLHHHRYSISGI